MVNISIVEHIAVMYVPSFHIILSFLAPGRPNRFQGLLFSGNYRCFTFDIATVLEKTITCCVK